MGNFMRDNPLVSPSEVNRHHYTLAFLGSGSKRFEEENGTLDDYDLAVKKVCCCLNVIFCFICSFGFLLNVNKELPFLILHYQPVYVSECFFNWSSTHESLVLVNSIKKRKSYYMPYQLYINSHENTISFWVFLIPFYIKLITHETF